MVWPSDTPVSGLSKVMSIVSSSLEENLYVSTQQASTPRVDTHVRLTMHGTMSAHDLDLYCAKQMSIPPSSRSSSGGWSRQSGAQSRTRTDCTLSSGLSLCREMFRCRVRVGETGAHLPGTARISFRLGSLRATYHRSF